SAALPVLLLPRARVVRHRRLGAVLPPPRREARRHGDRRVLDVAVDQPVVGERGGEVPLELEGELRVARLRYAVLQLRLEAELVASAVVRLALLVQDEGPGGPADVDRDRQAAQRDARADGDGAIPLYHVGVRLLAVQP